MPRRRSCDYKVILKVLKDFIPDISLSSVVLDFEATMWTAFRAVFPDVSLQGCVFHLTQAVYRKIADVGLKSAYQKSGAVHEFLRQVLALPFLPAEHIPGALDNLDQRATTLVRPVMDYLRATWSENPMWPVDSWSVFGQAYKRAEEIVCNHAGKDLQIVE